MNLSRFKALVLSCVATVAFVGCGGGSDSTATAPVVATGTFVDAPVQGLKYTTATQTGYTDSNGTYKYVAGEQVEFFLGTLSLGKVTASVLTTPYTMAGDTNISAPSDKAKNIAMLLQNFDSNRSDSVLDVSKLKDHDFSDMNLSATTAAMETKITALLGTLNTVGLVDTTTHSLINADVASAAMKTYVADATLKSNAKFTAEYLSGKTFYMVSNWGSVGWVTLTNTFHSDGTNSYYDAPDANGTVDYAVTTDGRLKIMSRDPSDPIFYATIKAVTDEYIEVNEYTESTATYKSTNTYMYFDKAKANAKLASLQSATVSVGSGFGTEWLNNRTLWFVILDTEDDNHNGSTTDHILVSRAFSNGNTTLDFDADGRDIINGGTYTLINGAIKILYGSEWEQNNITAINGDKITETFTANWSSPTTEYLFTTKVSAQAYLAQLIP